MSIGEQHIIGRHETVLPAIVRWSGALARRDQVIRLKIGIANKSERLKTRSVHVFGALLTIGYLGCAPAAGDGGTGSCTTPAGTYGVTVVNAGGTCGTDYGAKMAAMLTQDVEKKAEPCGQYTKVIESPLNGTTCSLKGKNVTVMGSDGYKGTLDLTVTCTDGSTCTQKFNAYYTKR